MEKWNEGTIELVPGTRIVLRRIREGAGDSSRRRRGVPSSVFARQESNPQKNRRQIESLVSFGPSSSNNSATLLLCFPEGAFSSSFVYGLPTYLYYLRRENGSLPVRLLSPPSIFSDSFIEIEIPNNYVRERTLRYIIPQMLDRYIITIDTN